MQISAHLSSSEHTIQNVHKMKRKPARSELSHLLCRTDNWQLPTILFPGETGWWDATGLADQANQAPFSDCQLRAVIQARNAWWHCKEKSNKCNLWNNTLSASSKPQMTLMQISAIQLWSNDKDCLLNANQALGGEQYTWEWLHPSFWALRAAACTGFILGCF